MNYLFRDASISSSGPLVLSQAQLLEPQIKMTAEMDE